MRFKKVAKNMYIIILPEMKRKTFQTVNINNARKKKEI